MITSRSNTLIKTARSLRRGGGRKSDHFLVEGIHLVGAAVETGWPIENVLFSGDLLTSQYGRRLVERLGSVAEEVSAPVFEAVAGKQNPQGIMAIARRRTIPLDSLESLGFGAAVVSPQDPGNVGTILRTLDAVGGSVLFLIDGGVDAYHPTAVRAAMGASFVIPIIEAGLDELDAWRRTRAIQLIGSSAHAQKEYLEIQPVKPWILLLGNEQKGLSESQQQTCDVVARLPMYGRGSSLNLAVAAGILLFHYGSAPTSRGFAGI